MQRLQKRRPFPWLIAGIVVLFAAGGFVAWWFLLRQPASAPQTKTQPAAPVAQPAPRTPQIRFAAMGDMLAHDSVVHNAKTAEGYDFTQYFTRVRNMYKSADVIFCNPETLTTGPTFGITGYPTFNGPTEFARDLNKEGCNLINLATNHMNDKGQAAINANIDVWSKLPILAASGANKSADEQHTVTYFTKNNLKVAFVAFADFSNNTALTSYGINIYHNKDLVTQLLTEARKNADVVIVSAHWGTEDSGTVNADQQAAAQLFATLGADVVIGTGPHVLQKVTSISRPDGGSTLVWYSIGNMLSSQLKTDELTGGVAGFTIEKSGAKVAVKDLSFTTTFMSYDWPPADRTAGNLAARTNLGLYPLGEASDQLAKFGATLDERKQYVRTTLGTDVTVTVSP